MYKNSMQMQGKIYLHSNFWMPCKCMKFKYLRIRVGAAAMWQNIYKWPERKTAESVLHFIAEAFCIWVEASTRHHKRQKPTRSEPSERTKGNKCKSPFYSFTSVSVSVCLTLTDTEMLLPQWGQLTEAAPTEGAANSSVIGTFNAVAIFSSVDNVVLPLRLFASPTGVIPTSAAKCFCVIPFVLQISFILKFIPLYFLFIALMLQKYNEIVIYL